MKGSVEFGLGRSQKVQKPQVGGIVMNPPVSLNVEFGGTRVPQIQNAGVGCEHFFYTVFPSFPIFFMEYP